MGRLGRENAFDQLDLANRLGAKYRFEIGETGSRVPSHVIDDIVDALREGRTTYGPSAGNRVLRAEVARYFETSRGLPPVDLERTVVASGGKAIIAFAMLACVDHGDEVIVPDLGYPAYRSMAEFAGGRVISWPLRLENGFLPDADDLARLITPRTVMIVLNSPSNPTGSVLTREALDRIVAVLRRVGYKGWIFSDEVYRDSIFTGVKPPSILDYPDFIDQVIALDGWSKRYSMTGLRLGCGIMIIELAQMMGLLANNVYSCPSVVIQEGGLAALRGSHEFLVERLATLRRRRDRMVRLLNEMGLPCQLPDGAFYVCPDVSGRTNSASRLATLAVHTVGVSFLGGRCFGTDECGAEKVARFCYSTNREAMIEEGMGVLANFIGTRDYFKFDLTREEPVLI
jgi:aspartate/methionine/tyrosine aminotransferase